MAGVDVNSRDDTNQTARTGPSGISGGTAFSIQGINLGTQYPTSASTASSSGVGYDHGISLQTALIAAGALVGLALLWKFLK